MPQFAGSGRTPSDSLGPVALTAAEANRILGFRGKLVPGIPDKVPDPTEQRLQLDRVLFPRSS